ncbi:hypothetical protein NQ318_008744 [Aromia moschata]|uniref:BCL-6 corepressor n=1 Tax=Aromia moschata TaxID=1265417 RepID=A0AAV8XZF2_9CUCU|nr:hypothetical protein NQ318_008744 [Aromia moschata]
MLLKCTQEEASRPAAWRKTCNITSKSHSESQGHVLGTDTSDLSRCNLQVMDVTFTNVLEGARQYFQGLPAGTSSTAGPTYSTEVHHRNDPEQNQDMPPSSNSYWPQPPAEPARLPSGDHNSVQRPPSHSSDTARPQSHSQYIHNVPMEQNRIRYPNTYQEQYSASQPQQQQQQQQQSFQFSRPQSREAPSNHSQYQSHIPTNSIAATSSGSLNRTDSPARSLKEQPVPRAPSREQLVPRVPSREQMTSQYPQASESYANYSQSRSYYSMQSQPKSAPSNNAYKPPTPHQSYTSSQQQNAYYKHIYSSQPQSSQQNIYANTRPSSTQHPEVNQNIHSTPVSSGNAEQAAIRTTHNLPPIAALSSYHSSRNAREPSRSVSTSSSRTKSFSSNSYNVNASQQNSTVTSNSSNIQQTPARSHSYSSSVTPSNYQQDYRAYTTQSYQQQYQYSTTVTTQSYSHVIMTTSNTSSYFSTPTQSQSSSQSYYQTAKQHSMQNTSRNPPNQTPTITPTSQSQQQNSMDHNLNGRLVMKRESPLDLSVKTVRTPADSTLGDAENESRNKYYQSNRPAQSSISAHRYPQVDVNAFSQSVAQRSTQSQSVTAPKVEFHPNFNVPSLNQPPKLPKRVDESKRNVLPEKAHSSNRTLQDNKNIPYPSSTTNRYPTVSIPSAAHVNSYIKSQQVPPKNQLTSRMDFSAPVHKTNSVYTVPSQDVQKKRPADVAPSIVPSKIAKSEIWRESIDMQIEQKLLSYQQQQQAKLVHPTAKPSLVNGTYSALNQEKAKETYSAYQKQNYENIPHSSYNASSHYQVPTNHTQTYVPSPATTHQYPNYGFISQQPQASNTYLHPASRTNSSPSTVPTNTKNNLGGAVDKKVLHLLRNSLEIKGQKKIFEQLKSHENFTQHPRSDVQHPSTDVTAPLQPKPGLIGRNNVSPFTPTSFPDNNMASMYKFHIPKALDSINFDSTKCQNPILDKQTLDTVITNHSSSNPDYDGLAAFLAARIRTKGELKQGGPTTQNASNNNSSISEVRLHGIIENQLKSPGRQDTVQSSTSCTNSDTTCPSPPKVSKERQPSFTPRKRLFSRNEEEPTNNNVTPKDKTGFRSSSETSIFDFPDSDSETDMNGRESLEAMRKGRKSSLRQSTPVPNSDFKVESPRPASPSDDIFSKLCDNFVDQLKSGAIKRKVRRKKPMEPEVLAKLETVAKENSLENEFKNKSEVDELNESAENWEVVKEENTPENPPVIKKEEIKDVPLETEPVTEDPKILGEIKPTPETERESMSNVDSEIKNEDPVFIKHKRSVRRRLVSSSDSSESDTDTVKNEKNKKDNKITDCTEQTVKLPTTDQGKTESDIGQKKETGSPQKSNEVLPIIRPAKKPSFGDGSDFYPGWEEGVYKYKKSLRMPPTLIQVTRPPQFHRLSTSLPDLDPCPQSPTTSIAADHEKDSPKKIKLKKIKSEPLDSDNESNSSFNLFSKKTNYDSEGSASVRSLPNTAKEMSILDKLLEKCGGRKKRKLKRKDDHSPKIIPKAENAVELLPTPSLQIKDEVGKESKKLASPVIKTESARLDFRKKTINNFKDAFMKSANNFVNEQFTTVVLKSRTRKETREFKQRATIKEVFGEDRPASAPPVTCVNEIQIKEDIPEPDENSCLGNLVIKLEKQDGILERDSITECKIKDEKHNDIADTKQMLKNKLLNRDKKKEINSPVKNPTDKKTKTEVQDEIEDETRSLEDVVIKRDPDEKSESPSIDGDDGSISGKRRGKYGKMRRKLSSGFDYIRKKKKVKKEGVESECGDKKKRKNVLAKTLESIDDIQKEIKTWVLNKGIGETHLHRAARLGYTDITAYCLEKMNCHPSPKDNAGYTPLHEACSKGHLDIAKLLLLYGANASESAQGGIRPLHEAVENGFVEIARLLLSYGADPTLATYSGLTPLALTNDEVTKEFLKNHLNDIEGEPSPPWCSYGPATFFDPVSEIGYYILDDIPSPDPEIEEEDIEFEVSESLLPNLYTLRSESLSDRWILLQDLSNLLKNKIKRRSVETDMPAIDI